MMYLIGTEEQRKAFEDENTSAEETRTVYSVLSGWITQVRVGDHIEDRYGDNPFCEDFDSYEEAKAAFDATDIARQWRTEKMCAGKAWDGRIAYKSIEVYEIDADGCSEYVETTDHETYDGDGEEA